MPGTPPHEVANPDPKTRQSFRAASISDPKPSEAMLPSTMEAARGEAQSAFGRMAIYRCD